jgi:hypothetical protein
MGKAWFDLSEDERIAIRARGMLISCHLQKERGYYVNLNGYPGPLDRYDVNTMTPLTEEDKKERVHYRNGDYLYD